LRCICHCAILRCWWRVWLVMRRMLPDPCCSGGKLFILTISFATPIAFFSFKFGSDLGQHCSVERCSAAGPVSSIDGLLSFIVFIVLIFLLELFWMETLVFAQGVP